MRKIVSVKTMKAGDKYTANNIISSKDLMLRAGKAVFENVNWVAPVAIVCGCGNNAGDGYVLAKLLYENGIECKIFLLQEKFSPDGKFFYEECLACGIPVTIFDEENINFKAFKTVVDCIFGTGFCGEVKDTAKTLIEKINTSGAYVVSVDINSGLNADNGLGECAIKSDLTISIGDFKCGHFLSMAKDLIKQKINVDIGIKIIDKNYWEFQAADCLKCLPHRKNFSNKGDFGYIALIGGSVKYSGALKLSNLASSAMRSGAGVVKLAAPKSIAESVMPFLLESTLFPLSENSGEIKFVQSEIENLIKNVKVVAFGMGIGVSGEVWKTLVYLFDNFDGTLIVDADGLNVLANNDLQKLKNAKCKVILTPHLKEFSRLTGQDIQTILNNPVELALSFAKKYGIILLLKGVATIVTDGEEVYFVDKGCAGMATAGSGDVLSGILAGVTAYNEKELLEATATAAYINGMAGELAEKSTNQISMVASDTAKHIAQAITTLIKENRKF